MFDFENTPIEKDTTLVAQWGEDCSGYTVSFDLDGGTSSVPIPNQTVKEGETATMPTATPSKDGCGFIGWYQKTDEDPDPEPEPGAGGTVNVMFRVDMGGPQPAGQEIVAGTMAQYPGAVSAEGCKFLGWYLAGEEPDEDVYSTVTVTFDTDGGSTILPQYVWVGDPVSAPTDPTKAGYDFDGWTLDGESYDFSQPVNEDITLVAIWTEKAYQLPDLSKPLDKNGLDNLSAIVKDGKASEYLNLGDELLVSYGTFTMPFEVVGFTDVTIQNNGMDETVPAINLLSKYLSPTSSIWNSNPITQYASTTLQSYITNTMQTQFNNDFVECLGATKIQRWRYYSDSASYTSYLKMYAPSATQLGATTSVGITASQQADEGPIFTSYQGASNAKRIKYLLNNTSQAQNYWTSSRYINTTTDSFYIASTGSINSYDTNTNFYVAVTCNFIGNN